MISNLEFSFQMLSTKFWMTEMQKTSLPQVHNVIVYLALYSTVIAFFALSNIILTSMDKIPFIQTRLHLNYKVTYQVRRRKTYVKDRLIPRLVTIVLVARLAVRQARVWFLARHHREVFPTELTCVKRWRETSANGDWSMCIVRMWLNECMFVMKYEK